jgi:CrcB protein
VINTLAIAAGGALGALFRYWVSNAVYAVMGRDFPYGTLVVNVAGSLLMGLLFVLLIERLTADVAWRAFLLIGLLGSFTTFSTFSIETLNLLESGEYLRSIMNVVLSVLVCIGAAWAGVLLGRQV